MCSVFLTGDAHLPQGIPGVPPLVDDASAEGGAGLEPGGAVRNPATWMLDISTPASEDAIGVDFAAIWQKSDLARLGPAAHSQSLVYRKIIGLGLSEVCMMHVTNCAGCASNACASIVDGNNQQHFLLDICAPADADLALCRRMEEVIREGSKPSALPLSFPRRCAPCFKASLLSCLSHNLA